MLKVGLIGCGFMGTMHANCYKNIKDVEIVALADLRKEKAEELAAGTNAVIYGDGKDLIENAELDIIDICLPTYLHCEYALLAMEKCKYVFVEKPVALKKDEGKKLLKKQAQTGCNVQIGQVIRFWDEYVKPLPPGSPRGQRGSPWRSDRPGYQKGLCRLCRSR